MITAQDQIAETARRGQEVVTNALQTWADNVQKMVGGLPNHEPKLPSPTEVVDTFFDITEQVLATQREFAKSILAASVAPVSEIGKAANGRAAHNAGPANPANSANPANPANPKATPSGTATATAKA